MWQSPIGKQEVPHWASMLRWIWSISECNLKIRDSGKQTPKGGLLKWTRRGSGPEKKQPKHNPYWPEGRNWRKPHDSCHEKIDLFRVYNWVIHDHAWWKGSQIYHVMFWMADEFLVNLIPNLPQWFKRNRFYESFKTQKLPKFWTPKRSIFSWHASHVLTFDLINLAHFAHVTWSLLGAREISGTCLQCVWQRSTRSIETQRGVPMRSYGLY